VIFMVAETGGILPQPPRRGNMEKKRARTLAARLARETTISRPAVFSLRVVPSVC